MADTTTTDAEWSERFGAARKRMQAALAKIDHGRRAELIHKKVYGLALCILAEECGYGR